MVDCPTYRECSLLMHVLGARCERCFKIDPRVKAQIALLQAKLDAKPAHTKAPRRTWARGLRDAQRVNQRPTGTSRGRTTA